MHLAKLMHRTVDELLDSMSYPEILRWEQYFELFPEESWRNDAGLAQIACILANVNRDTKQRSKPFEVADFMLFDKPRRAREQEREQAKAKEESAGDGAKIAPETLAWLFGKAKQTADKATQ